MLNVKHTIKGDVLTIVVDLSERHGPSGSGKTVRIASTNGNMKLEGKHSSVMFGLNVYTKETAAG